MRIDSAEQLIQQFKTIDSKLKISKSKGSIYMISQNRTSKRSKSMRFYQIRSNQTGLVSSIKKDL